MDAASARVWPAALLLLLAGIVCVGVAGSTERKSIPAAPPITSGHGTAALVPGEPAGTPDREPAQRPGLDPTAKAADDDRKAQIRAIDEKIRSLREEFKAQADPLQAQVRALRDRLDADLKPLEEQRKSLVEQGESPAWIALSEEEGRQLAALAEREKADIEQVRQRYEEQKKAIQQDFQKRRQELGKK